MIRRKYAVSSFIKSGLNAFFALAFIITTTHAEERKNDPTGLWKWTVPGRNGAVDRVVNLKLKATAGNLTGALITSNRTNDSFTEVEIKDGKIDGSDLSFNTSRAGRNGGNPILTKYAGKLSGDKIEGKIENPNRDGTTRTNDWKAERNTTGQLIAGPRVEIKPGYDESGHKIVNETKFKELSVADAEKFLAEHPEAVILDLRPPQDYTAGHLPNAKNYDVSDEATYKDVLAPLDKSKWYLVHSVVGHFRTVRALEYFEANGFQHAVAIDGGYNAWADAGKPTVK